MASATLGEQLSAKNHPGDNFANTGGHLLKRLFFAERFQVGEISFSAHGLLIGNELISSDIRHENIAVFPMYPICIGIFPRNAREGR